MRSTILTTLMLATALTAGACASRRPAPAEAAPGPAAEAAPPSEPGRAPVESRAEAPAPRGLQQEFAATAGDRVYFELDSATLTSDARAVLDRQAEWLARNPTLSILVAGNCDERGTREYNLALGARRAQAVLDHLAGRGVSRARIRTISYGKERPIDGGADEAAWARNRNAQTLLGGAA